MCENNEIILRYLAAEMRATAIRNTRNMEVPRNLPPIPDECIRDILLDDQHLIIGMVLETFSAHGYGVWRLSVSHADINEEVNQDLAHMIARVFLGNIFYAVSQEILPPDLRKVLQFIAVHSPEKTRHGR